jgi:hypothetical protein
MSRNSFKAVFRVVGFIGVGRVDPLICPHCNGEMKLILLIDEHCIIEPILRHLGLWHESESVHAPPSKSAGTALVYGSDFSQSGTNTGILISDICMV